MIALNIAAYVFIAAVWCWLVWRLFRGLGGDDNDTA